MAAWEDRVADYQKRQAAGTLHSNPFAGLGGQLAKTAGMIPEGWGLLGDAAPSFVKAGGGLLEDAYNKMKYNATEGRARAHALEFPANPKDNSKKLWL